MMNKERFLEFPEVVLKDSYKKIAILPHIFPDGDTIGSAIGIAEWLKHHQKKGYIVLDDDIPSNLCFMFEDLDQPLSVEEALKQEWDLVIVVDCGETKLFGDRLNLFEKAKMTVAIDHHKTHVPYAEWSLVDEHFSSTGEMVAQLFIENGVPFSKEAGRALYTAIVTDTGSFRYSNTAPSTFEVSSHLVKTGFDFNHLNVELFQNKAMEKVQLLNHIFGTLELYFDNRLAVVSLTQAMMAELKFQEYDADGVVEFVRDIKGIEVVVFIRYIGNGDHKVSMRSKHNIDVSAIAKHFSGGGHTKAAGFKTSSPLDSFKHQLISTFKEACFNE